MLTLFRDETTSKRGNPTGANQHSVKDDDAGKNNNVIISTEDKAHQGNSKAYTASRLSKQNPELFAKVVKGEMSANQAAIVLAFNRSHFTRQGMGSGSVTASDQIVTAQRGQCLFDELKK